MAGLLYTDSKEWNFYKEIHENLSVIAASNDKYALLELLLTGFYKVRIRDYTQRCNSGK